MDFGLKDSKIERLTTTTSSPRRRHACSTKLLPSPSSSRSWVHDGRDDDGGKGFKCFSVLGF